MLRKFFPNLFLLLAGSLFAQPIPPPGTNSTALMATCSQQGATTFKASLGSFIAGTALTRCYFAPNALMQTIDRGELQAAIEAQYGISVQDAALTSDTISYQKQHSVAQQIVDYAGWAADGASFVGALKDLNPVWVGGLAAAGAVCKLIANRLTTKVPAATATIVGFLQVPTVQIGPGKGASLFLLTEYRKQLKPYQVRVR